MSNMIEGVGQIGAKVFENPVGQQGFEAHSPTISGLADSILSGIGKLQTQMNSGLAEPMSNPQSAVQSMSRPAEGDRVPDGMVGEQTQILAEQIEASTRVQTQLVQFVMASSMSSSLGRNLNMFLRGQ